LGHVQFLQRFTALQDSRTHKPAAFLSLAGLPVPSTFLATPPTMRPDALLILAVCLFAAFAAAWTKEGTYASIAHTLSVFGSAATLFVAMQSPHIDALS
jgi:hypothetical protein|tara:strand:+ start:1823 stop:2119 length:297 start_codon:yes stop_codon:yes gene_type:complete